MSAKTCAESKPARKKRVGSETLRRVAKGKTTKTNLLDLVIPLQSHPEVSSRQVHISILDEEPKALHLDEIGCWGRSVLLLDQKATTERDESVQAFLFHLPLLPSESEKRDFGRTLVNSPRTPKALSSCPALNQYFPALEFKNLS